MQHNKKEIKHILNERDKAILKRQTNLQYNKKARVENVKNKVQVQNQLVMNNQERFENVCFGYSIQAERLMKIVQLAISRKVTSETLNIVNPAYEAMKKVQRNLQGLENLYKKYNKHINNSIYCKTILTTYVRNLEKIIEETDALMKGGA